MATVPKITKTVVDSLVASDDRPVVVWDRSLPGFGVKCTPRGVKRYVVKYRSGGGGRSAKQRWLTLGSHGQLTPDQARKMAQQALASVARGDDPQDTKFSQRQIVSLGDVWDRFKTEHLVSRKPQTRRDYEAQWLRFLEPRFGKAPVKTVSRGDVELLHKSLRRTPYQANRVLALLSRLMTLSEAWDLRDGGSNPCRYVERFKEKPRSRYLTFAEITRLGSAIEAMLEEEAMTASAANAIQMLLLTGARLNEVLSAEWLWVDVQQKLLSLPDSKTGAKTIFLSDAALAIIGHQRAVSGESDFIFPGTGKNGRMINLSKPWIKLCQRAGLAKVRLHDLRHTAASVAVGQGASLPMIGRLLGHTQAQTTLRYAHIDSDPALQAANSIGAAIDKALSHREN